MSRLNLTSWQRQRLCQQLATAHDTRLYRRTLAVLEFDRGRAAGDIARMLGVTRQSVYNWVGAYSQAHRPAALADEAREGRPPLLGEDDRALLRALLADSPQDLGYPHTGWTVPLLQEVYESGLGRRHSADTFRRALRRMGYVWKRPRYVLAPDPRREKKKPHPAAGAGAAPRQCRAGAGRDGPADVPAAAGGLGAAG